MIRSLPPPSGGSSIHNTLHLWASLSPGLQTARRRRGLQPEVDAADETHDSLDGPQVPAQQNEMETDRIISRSAP